MTNLMYDWKNRIWLFFKSNFFKSISVLFAGTLGAQILSVLVIPVLTRMYDVENFGTRAVLISIATLLGIVATGKYEQAILLSDRDEDSFSVAALALMLSLLFSVSVLLMLFFIPEKMQKEWFNVNNIDLLFYLPIIVFINAAYNVLFFCFNRVKQYNKIALAGILCVVINFFTAFICAEKYGPNNFGLILYLLVGQTLVCLYGLIYFIGYFKKHGIMITFAEMKKQFYRYIKFPKYEIVGFFVNVLSTQLPVLALNSFGGQTVVGLFSMTQKLLGMPSAIIGSAISKVFIHDAAEEYRENGSCRNVYNKTFLLVTITGFIPYVIIFFFAEDLFGLLLGTKWIPAAKYCRYLCMMYYLSYVTSPLSNVLLLTENQKIDVMLQVFRVLISGMALYGAYYCGGDNDAVILSYGLAFVGIYLVDMGLNYHYAKK